jgi:hypothetical protein
MATNLEFIKSASGSGVSSLDVTDCFSDKYDVYYVSIADIDYSTSAAGKFRYLDSGGTVIDQAEYDFCYLQLRAYAAFQEIRGTGQTSIFYGDDTTGGTAETGGTSMYIFNPYDSSSYTFYSSQHSNTTSNNGIGAKIIGVHKSTEQLSGIRFLPSAGTYDNITANIYGVK